MDIETKRIGRVTYLYHRKKMLLGEIKGPYRPGNVWKSEVYQVKPEFEEAWNTNKITPVQRGIINHNQDRVISAMSFSQTNGVASELYTENKVLGYLYKRKKEAVEAAEKVLNVVMWV